MKIEALSGICEGYLKRLESIPELKILPVNDRGRLVKTEHGDAELYISHDSRNAVLTIYGSPLTTSYLLQLFINYHKRVRSRTISQFQPYRELEL